MKYLHVACLQQWLKNRLVSRNTEKSLHYSWKALDCELCKQPLPSAVTVQGNYYSLISVDATDIPYVIFESYKRGLATTRGVHLIKLIDSNPVVIGRGNESDVRISNDVSVSRFHASIRKVKDGVLLEDQGSKFGTLVQMRQGAVLKPGSSLAFQINRTILHIKNPSTWSFKSFCSKLCCFKASRSRQNSTVPLESSEPIASSSRQLTPAQSPVSEELEIQQSSEHHEDQLLNPGFEQVSHSLPVQECNFSPQDNEVEEIRLDQYVESEAQTEPAYN